MTSLACRLGSGAGFAGDRVDAAVRMVAAGEVDAIALECLAERTLVPAIRARRENPQAGFDPRLQRRLTPLLPVARQIIEALLVIEAAKRAEDRVEWFPRGKWATIQAMQERTERELRWMFSGEAPAGRDGG